MGRAPCCAKVGIHRGRWTAEEDEILTKYIQSHGEGSWRDLPKNAGLLRCGKSCRLRWINYLRSDLKRGNISAEEDELIIQLHGLLGNRWSMIATRIPGRTDNEIKNYWNTHLSRKLGDTGINPVTHRPFYCDFSLQPKKDNKPELSSSIDSSTLLGEHMEKSGETEKPMKKTSVVKTGTCKRKKPVCDKKGALKKKKATIEQLSSRISNQSSCELGSEKNSDETNLSLQSKKCNASVDEKAELPILLQNENPTSSLTGNSSNLWEESLSSNILPSDMDLFGLFDTEDFIMFGNQLPYSNSGDDKSNNMEGTTTDDLWSFFSLNTEEFCYPSSSPSHLSSPILMVNYE